MTALRCLAALLVTLFLLALAAPAEAGRVGLRTGVHPGFARMVFDWPQPVGYKAELRAGYLEVTFARPADFDLKVLDKRLKKYVAGAQVSGDRRSVLFTLKGSFGLKHFTLGPKVVLDLHFSGDRAKARDVGPAPGQAPPKPPPTVALRGAQDSQLSRLVFHWPEPVSVKVAKRRGGVRLQFDRPAKLDTTRLRTGKLKQIAKVRARQRDAGLAVDIDLRSGAKLRHWKDGLRVVVDVSRPIPETKPPEPAKQAEPAETSDPDGAAMEAAAAKDKPVESAATKPGRPLRLVPDRPWNAQRPQPSERHRPVAAQTASEQAETTPEDVAAALAEAGLAPAAGEPESEPESEETPSRAAKAPIPLTKPREAVAPKQAAEDAAVSETTPADEAAREPAVDAPEAKDGPPAIAAKPDAEPDAAKAEGAKAEDAEAVGAEPAGKQGEAATATEDLVAAVEADGVPAAEDSEAGETEEAARFVPDPAPLPGHLAPREKPVALRFNWAEPTAAATFRRGEHIWLVFDRRTEAGLAQRIAAVAPELSPVTLNSATGTVVRLTAAHRLSPRLIPEGMAWVLDLRVRPSRLELPLTIVLDAKSVRPRAMVPLKQPGRLQSFVDPSLGDRLYVAPVRLAGQGLASQHDFPEFRVLAAEQGIVLRPKTESLSISIVGSTLVVTGPNGLLLSSSRQREAAEADTLFATPGQRLFDLWAWREGGLRQFTKRRKALQKAQSQARGPERSLARLRLARFYFAHGLSVEAAGVLAVLAEEDARLARDPQVLVMRAGSFVLNKQYAEARELLEESVLTGEPEATLWRAALAALSRDWAYAAAGFKESATLIADYVPLVRHRLRLLAAEAQIEVGDAATAGIFLGKIRDDDPDEALLSDVSYLEGRRLLLESDHSSAKRYWDLVVTKADNRRAEARARLALIDLALERGEMTPAQAIEALESLQFAWRGDAFEFGLLERRAELFIEMGKYREGLLSFRRAASNLADVGRAGKVTERMRQVFRELFLGELGAELAPIKKLALYEEFRELTPPGEVGDQVVEGLARKLAAVDLLPEAIALLQRQVTYRLDGVEKARVGAEIAHLNLLNDDPLGALEGLDESDVEETLPDALERARRYMRARALSLKDQFEEALVVLGPDDSTQAQRLRFEIRWRWRDWPGAAEVIDAMLPEELPVDAAPEAEQAELITALAVAYALADDLGGLADLKWRFGPAMELSDRKDTFIMLTGDLDRGMVTSIADELRGVAHIDSFLNRYNERWQEASLSEETAQQ